MSNSQLHKRRSINLLLQQDGAESGVEGTNTFILQDLAETTNKTIGECGLRNETDTGSLKRTKGNIGEELGGSSRSEIDCSTVVGSGFKTELVDALCLEEFVSSELKGTLEEIPGECRSDTSPDGTEAFCSDYLPKSTDEASVVLDGVELYPSLDAARR